MPQLKSFVQCSNTYMYTTHVINSNREHSEILKRFFDKLVDIEINIIFKIYFENSIQNTQFWSIH